ncbi:hypothetical protein [Prosthecobacter vanneervenii]|uniref:Lipoprotein n=1 Tax=Prosthecobacter vanneervenii TaxID=48466 RepID=A0A7W8DMP7_9BACT|nr:hypothetical protein [Prosthecobacter vanneervenii]MBB5035076.1 hypothetical protein [Prosthecobacter vanneervenii]
MKTRFFCLLLSAITIACSLTSCTSDEPKRKKVVGPDSGNSNLPWNRPRSWEGNARYGGMVPVSR